MSIRSAGTVLSCLQHSYHSARRSPWAPLSAAVFALSSLSSKKSSHPERNPGSTTSPSTDLHELNAETGGNEADPIRRAPVPIRFVTRRAQWQIEKQNNRDVHLEKYGLLPGATSEMTPFIQRIWKKSRHGSWHVLYWKLAFPEDGDFARAQKEMFYYTCEATKLLVLSQKYRGIPQDCKMKHMAPFLIGALAQSAKSALRLMTLMEGVPEFSFSIKCDCLLYLGRVHRSEIETEPDLQEIYDGEIDKVAGFTGWPNPMPKSALLAMLNHSSCQRRQEIIESVLAAYDPVPPELLLLMVDYYTKQEMPHDAIAILSRLSPDDLKLLRQDVDHRYYALINIDNVERSDSGLNFKLLPSLLEKGLPLTDDMHCAVIARAVKLGLPDVAWEVFRFMEANQMDVNANGHLALLRDSFQRGDLDGLNLIMSKIHQRKDLVSNPFLVSYAMNIVRYVCYFERQLPVTESLAHVLAVYDRAYDRAPLVKLALADPLPPSETNATLPQPDGRQLSFALWTYVLIQRSDHHVSHFWHHFTQLVARGEPDMCDVARHDVLYNGLIVYWGRKKATLLNAVEVLEDMERLGLCTPTELTWIMVITAFMRHGQEASAEQIRQMMMTKGVKTNPNNWNFLMKEYSDSNLIAHAKHDLGKKRTAHGQGTRSEAAENPQSSVLDWEKIAMPRSPI